MGCDILRCLHFVGAVRGAFVESGDLLKFDDYSCVDFHGIKKAVISWHILEKI